jgi:predicted TIM-barrel fold metal-dependent hydrolase
MHRSRRDFLKLGSRSLALLAAPAVGDASAGEAGEPIIDVHLHAYPATLQFDQPIVNPITGRKSPIRNGADHLAACLAEMRRLNVTRGVVSGGLGDRLAAAVDWHERDPARILVGAGVRGSEDTPLPPLDELRQLHAQGRLQAIGELSAQYAGRSLSDPQYDALLALAEELDVPVALHTGSMPEGTTFDPCCRAARARFGNPEHVEEALNRHPRLRLNLMHCGWPYLEDTMAMLMLYPNVYADTGAIDWLLPRAAFDDYLQALVKAGFGQRIMFGTDQMFWPDAIGLAIDRIRKAGFLTKAQKRDILYNNAVRFYRLG